MQSRRQTSDRQTDRQRNEDHYCFGLMKIDPLSTKFTPSVTLIHQHVSLSNFIRLSDFATDWQTDWRTEYNTNRPPEEYHTMQ